MSGAGRLVRWLLLLPWVALPAAGQDAYQLPGKVPVAWNRLYNYDDVVRICRELTAAYPELLTMESIGKSVAGRDMWALTLNVAATGGHADKPAMYIDANVHGNEVQGSEVVLYTIWYLTKSYGKVPALTALMDRASFYFVPMVNPDGRAHWFDAPNTASSSRSGVLPTDNDGDGLFDEDPANDLNGDGHITMMRRVDPHGRWRLDPDDPRVLQRVPRDARGDFVRYEYIGLEGIDDDGDGRINEDGLGGYDGNRNWPADWQPNYIQYGAGEYPLSLPESRAIADFIVARPNIAAVQSYHNSGGMLLRGPGADYVEYPRADLAVYDRIGEAGAELLPFYRYLVIHKDLYTVHGGFVDWTAEDLGIISFTNELWTSQKNFGRDERAEGERMRFQDRLLFGQQWVEWQPFEHPLYGPIEIGGTTQFTGRVPPPFHLEEECHRNFAFTMFHAGQMPELTLEQLEVSDLGAGLYRVRVDVRNHQAIPTVTAQAAARRYGPRDRVRIEGPGLRIVAGGELTDRFEGAFRFVEHNPHRLWVDAGIGGESGRTFQWLVAGSGDAKVTYEGPRVRDVALDFHIGG